MKLPGPPASVRLRVIARCEDYDQTPDDLVEELGLAHLEEFELENDSGAPSSVDVTEVTVPELSGAPDAQLVFVIEVKHEPAGGPRVSRADIAAEIEARLPTWFAWRGTDYTVTSVEVL